jgi:hypothetical protein
MLKSHLGASDSMGMSYITILDYCCGLPPSSHLNFPSKKIQSLGNEYSSIPVKWIWYFFNFDQTNEEVQVRAADQVTRERWEIAGSKDLAGQL